MNLGKIAVSTTTARLRPLSWGLQCQGLKFDSLNTWARASRFAYTGTVKDQSVSGKNYLASGLPLSTVYQRRPNSAFAEAASGPRSRRQQ